MRIVYLILAHRYPEQLIKLVDRLNMDHTHFLIHWDKKVGNNDFSFLESTFLKYGNVEFIKRYTCHWAGFGIVEASYEGLKLVVEKNIPCDYLCLMSGQDYPIKSNEYILNFFERHNGKSFINYNLLPHPTWRDHNGGYDRLTNWYFVTKSQQYGFPNKLFRSRPRLSHLIKNTIGKLFPNRKFPSGFIPYGGAQFWALNIKHVKYIYEAIYGNPDFYKFFRYVMVADEFMFQTIMGNYPNQEELVNTTLHFLEWDRVGAILNYGDKENILNTDHLFARKFDFNVDPSIMEYLDNQVL
ncbi:beta-1,6-N-acetylglucosaminyltransferase [Litoribacter populi]|uniref:beta-1,6-N-acetylglucosaminyltransferase n=1 Tax=Litoribacter populi TaxID=2598460 RepID=UPI00117E9A94|nr:beta-1,6-N-acetylglucosaminyltransferase [Litoribacter populi]